MKLLNQEIMSYVLPDLIINKNAGIRAIEIAIKFDPTGNIKLEQRKWYH